MLNIFSYYKCFRANGKAKIHAIAAAHDENLAKRNEHIESMVRYLFSIEQRYPVTDIGVVICHRVSMGGELSYPYMTIVI